MVDDTDDTVDTVLIDQQAGETGGGKCLGHLFGGGIDADGLEIHAMRENILCGEVTEFHGISQQLALFLVKTAVLLDLFNKGQQLFLRHGLFFLGGYDAIGKFLPKAEDKGKRKQKLRNEVNDRCGEHSKGIRSVLCQTLGGDLTENEHEHRYDRGRDRCAEAGIAVVCKERDKNHRGNGREGDVDDVVADEDGGDEPVVFLVKLQGKLCFFVALVRKHLETGLVHGEKRRFRGGEIGGENETYHHDDDTGYMFGNHL